MPRSQRSSLAMTIPLGGGIERERGLERRRLARVERSNGPQRVAHEPVDHRDAVFGNLNVSRANAVAQLVEREIGSILRHVKPSCGRRFYVARRWRTSAALARGPQIRHSRDIRPHVQSRKEDQAMEATAAILYEVNKPLVVEDVEVLEPGPREVLVRFVANGVCHSDLHVMTGDYPHPLPVVLGHEAAGIVDKVGADVDSVQPGDHVCSSYIPSCGRCSYCINGTPTLCALRDKPRWFMHDGTPRFRRGGQGLHHFLQVSGYATHAVLPEPSVIPIRRDAPLDVRGLVGCGWLAGGGPVCKLAQ